jgi:hypothetical protein
MERYFDAHLYLANWGTRRIALRWPIGLLDPEIAATYCLGESARSWATDEHVIVDLTSENEDGDDEWWENEDALATIVPVRAELAADDRRLLYLAWLLCVQNEDLNADEPEPPVPPGLDALSGPPRALADFLRLDADLLATAAEASAPLTRRTPPKAALAAWVKQLPQADKDKVIVRLLDGEGAHQRAELLRRYNGDEDQPAVGGGRTAGQLLAGAEERWTKRQRAADKRKAAERAHQEKAAEAARQQRLDAIAADPEQAWQYVRTLIAIKKPKEYDLAVALLTDLKAIAERDNQGNAFIAQVRQLREEHARKPSLIDRLDRAGLS